MKHPNLIFVFADQWRAQACGYAGDPNARTPNIDRFAEESVNCTNAVSGCPVCSPYRGSLMTGQYPLTHGVIVNDVPLKPKGTTFAQALVTAGYDTAYIGKWHLDARGRSAFIPPERRMGLQFWRVMECTHQYNESYYYADTDEKLLWDGYDARAQTREAQRYIRSHSTERPFALFLSWGPPHTPYDTAPEEFRRRFTPDNIRLRPNVPSAMTDAARGQLAGYYAHCMALDACFGDILRTIHERELGDDTIVVFTSDHGDMLCSQGSHSKKQQPWDESIRVPLLIRLPASLGESATEIVYPIDAPDLMPTLLRLCAVEVPDGVQGKGLSDTLRGGSAPDDEGAVLSNYFPFHDWTPRRGGREFRGLRTERYTYVRDLNGPWLLYDNVADPFQQENLCGHHDAREPQDRLDSALRGRLEALGDEFLPGEKHLRQWGYELNEKGDIPIRP